MRVLFLTCHLPWPPVSGGRLREWELLRRLEDVEVDLVAISKTPAEDRRNADRLGEVCRSVTMIDAEPGRDPCAPAQVNRYHSARARAAWAISSPPGSQTSSTSRATTSSTTFPRPVPLRSCSSNRTSSTNCWSNRRRWRSIPVRPGRWPPRRG